MHEGLDYALFVCTPMTAGTSTTLKIHKDFHMY